MRVLNRRELLAVGGACATWAAACRRGHCAANRPRWIDRRSYGPLQCAATFPLAEFDATFRELGHLEFELGRTLALPPVTTTVEVLLLDSARAHRDYLARLYPRVPYRRALYVQSGGRGAVYAYRHRELPIDLRHECTHALLHANLAMVPLWLDEGLAEYFEMPQPQRAFGHPHLAALGRSWKVRLGWIRDVESLEAVQDLAGMGAEEYRFAWAWVHFMLHGPTAAHRELVGYLADIRRGSPPGRLSERLESAVPRVNDRMAQHFKHWRR